MIAHLRQSGLLWSTVATIVAFGMLVALGNWQWQRMHWKQGLIKGFASATAEEPVDLRALTEANSRRAGTDLQALQFRRATATGTLLHDLEMHVWAPTPRGPAWSVVTPMQLQPASGDIAQTSAQSATHVLVIRGVVPAAHKDRAGRSEGDASGVQAATGRIRLDQPNAWANAPNISKNEWFTRDLATMAKHMQVSVPNSVRLVPFFLEAEKAMAPLPAPQPDLKALKLTNRHLEYALTWWALAATLLAVYAVFAASRLRTPKN